MILVSQKISKLGRLAVAGPLCTEDRDEINFGQAKRALELIGFIVESSSDSDCPILWLPEGWDYEKRIGTPDVKLINPDGIHALTIHDGWSWTPRDRFRINTKVIDGSNECYRYSYQFVPLIPGDKPEDFTGEITFLPALYPTLYSSDDEKNLVQAVAELIVQKYLLHHFGIDWDPDDESGLTQYRQVDTPKKSSVNPDETPEGYLPGEISFK